MPRTQYTQNGHSVKEDNPDKLAMRKAVPGILSEITSWFPLRSTSSVPVVEPAKVRDRHHFAFGRDSLDRALALGV
jgi:hypothetical protein